MKQLEHNLLLLTDAYKLTHWVQYPRFTQKVYSYFESRGGRWKLNLFFGLQYLLKTYLEGLVLTNETIYEAKSVSKSVFGNDLFNVDGWRYIVDKYGGRLPVEIRAVPEGTILPTKNVLITIENTDPQCYWLTNYLETLLVQCWYPTTVATQSWYMKQCIESYLKANGDLTGIEYKLHDFGFRGVSSVETAGIGGMSHLVNFKGTDTLEGILYAKEYYNADDPVGVSIPASEHSTITSWTKEGECKAFANMLKQYPAGYVACVSDSFDIFAACNDLWGERLHLKVLERNGTLVIRPDSGDPLVVLPRILNILADKFGVQKNSKGFKVLNPKVRVIQGDGIDASTLENILLKLHNEGWSADNIAFGSGGGLLQKLNRDDAKFAFKCSSIQINNEERDVYKSPITDNGKRSKSGRLSLVKVKGPNNSWSYRTIKQKEKDPIAHDELITVFRNGEILKEYDFSDVRRRAIETGNAVREFEGGI
jgi:nicotinamide phosphoribosyltransferase